MKFYLVVLLCLLLVLAGCNEEEKVTENQEGECSSKSASCALQMDWNLIVSKSNFPTRVRMLVQDKVVFDECLPSERTYKVNRGDNLSTIEVPNFIRLGKEEKFKMTLRDLGSCYENKLFHESEQQSYKIKELRNKKTIWIEI